MNEQNMKALQLGWGIGSDIEASISKGQEKSDAKQHEQDLNDRRLINQKIDADFGDDPNQFAKFNSIYYQKLIETRNPMKAYTAAKIQFTQPMAATPIIGGGVR